MCRNCFGMGILLLCANLFAQTQNTAYPDIIYDAYYSGVYDIFEKLYGGKGKDYPVRMDLNKILGDNKEWFVSLPIGSYIVYQYTDNEIFDAPNQDDIIVLEHGCCDEYAMVLVSNDGKEFFELGIVDDCGNNTLDLANIALKKPVRFIMIRGLDNKCSSPGFDLVNAYALPGANRDLYVGMAQIDEFFEEEKNDKSLILENVFFETDKYDILPQSEEDLYNVIEHLNQYPKLQILLTGHTDNVASENYNLQLSKKRAESVRNFFIKNGIPQNRLKIDFKGESQPLRSNESEEGRAINRRVVIRKLN